MNNMENICLFLIYFGFFAINYPDNPNSGEKRLWSGAMNSTMTVSLIQINGVMILQVMGQDGETMKQSFTLKPGLRMLK